MKHKGSKPLTPGAPKLGCSVPVRLEDDQEAGLRKLKSETGISRSALIRLGLSYFIPRFLNGEIDIRKCIREAESKKA